MINEKILNSKGDKDKIYYDEKVVGLGLRITKENKRFIFRYYFNRKQKFLTIGNYPYISLKEARVFAAGFRNDLINGIDPAKKKNKNITLKEFSAEFLNVKAKTLRPSTLKNYKNWCFDNHIIPALGKLEICSISKKDILNFYHKIEGKAIANKCLRVLSSMFSYAEDLELVDKNPTKNIKKFHEIPRERYLSDDEMIKIIDYLENSSEMSAKIILLIFFTGSRKNEVLKAKWEEFDLKKESWHKPAVRLKQKKSSSIPLNGIAIEILKKLEKNNDHLFLNSRTQKPIGDVKRFWQTMLKKLDIKNLTIHDLRHNFASFLLAEGVDLRTIGGLIGHANISSTQRYAHSADKTMREATGKFKIKKA